MRVRHCCRLIALGCLLFGLLFSGCGSKTSDAKKVNNSSSVEQKKQDNKKQEEQKTAVIPEEKIPSLAEVYKDFFTIGDGINYNDVLAKGDFIKKHFKSITCGNEMKWDFTNPSEGVFTFQQADAMVNFAVQNNIKVRGHTLAWYSQTPDWVFQDKDGKPASKEQLLSRLKEHINTEVGRYKGKVYCWDVVNEAISDNDSENLRDSKWYQIAGEDFISKAFQYAHEADPAAQLFYNDYGLENPVKRQKAYNMLKSMLEKGVPINGVGLQAHYDIYSPSIEDIKATIDLFSSLGLKVQLTEVDMSIYKWGDSAVFAEPPKDRMNIQTQRYKDLFTLLRSYKDKGVITGVTFWGVDDSGSWLDNFPVKGRKNWPMLFDINQRPKNAFWEVVNFDK